VYFGDDHIRRRVCLASSSSISRVTEDFGCDFPLPLGDLMESMGILKHAFGSPCCSGSLTEAKESPEQLWATVDCKDAASFT